MMRQLLILVAAVTTTHADIIMVEPGAGTISAAAAKAQSGDTIKLAAGEYTDSVQLPEGVVLEGAGAEKTVLTGRDYAAITCGLRTTIKGITIKGGDATVRGVNTSLPVRIERCRFIEMKEAVAMMGAPLSDVVACEFLDCGIGLRAIGEACPTVNGCWFKGGGMGIFGMDGMPVIRNNVFQDQRAGIRMVPGREQPVIRNNLFLACKDSGIELLPAKVVIFGPSIRNNIFSECGAAVTGSEQLLSRTSHGVVHNIKAPAFRDKDGAEVVKLGERFIVEGDPGLAMNGASTLTIASSAVVDGKGVEAGGDPKDWIPTIGPELAWRTVGVGAAARILPPVRFNPPMLHANAVAEEYQYIRALGYAMEQQSTGAEGGRQVDTLTCADGGKTVLVKFDITGLWQERTVKP